MNRLSIFVVGGLVGSVAVYIKLFKSKATEAELSAGKRLKEVRQELEELKQNIHRKRILMLKVAAASTVAIYLTIQLRAFYSYLTSPIKNIK